MKTYRIKFAPHATATAAQCERAGFGGRNEGATIQAEDIRAAVAAYNDARLPGEQLNPFYLTVAEVTP